MEYRFLGRSGIKVSALSFGTWVTFGDQVGEETAGACLKAAYEAGVNFFDAAEAYAHGKAEVMLGRLVRKFGWKRSDLVVSTKIFWGGPGPNDTGLSRKHIVEGTAASLKRLQMDYVDLIFCHAATYAMSAAHIHIAQHCQRPIDHAAGIDQGFGVSLGRQCHARPSARPARRRAREHGRHHPGPATAGI